MKKTITQQANQTFPFPTHGPAPSPWRRPHLLGAHVELGAHLARVAGEGGHGRQRGRLLLLVLLVHGGHQAEVAHLHHVVHREEDVGRLRDTRHTPSGL